MAIFELIDNLCLIPPEDEVIVRINGLDGDSIKEFTISSHNINRDYKTGKTYIDISACE